MLYTGWWDSQASGFFRTRYGEKEVYVCMCVLAYVCGWVLMRVCVRGWSSAFRLASRWEELSNLPDVSSWPNWDIYSVISRWERHWECNWESQWQDTLSRQWAPRFHPSCSPLTVPRDRGGCCCREGGMEERRIRNTNTPQRTIFQFAVKWHCVIAKDLSFPHIIASQIVY